MYKRVIFFFLISFFVRLTYAEKLNLSFEEAISRALKNNPQIMSLKAQEDIYKNKGRQAFSSFLPQLNASALYKRTTANSPAQVGLKIPSSLSSMTSSITGKRESMDSYNNYSLGLTLNQLIYDFGKTDGQYESTQFMVRSAKEDIKSNSDALVINLYQTVLNYTLNRELYDAAIQYEKQMENHIEMAKAQVKAGLRTDIDILKAETDLYNAKLNTLGLKNTLKLLKINLKNLLGIADETDIEILPPDKYEEKADISKNNYEYIKNRPEYVSYKNKIESLRSSLKVARSGYFPYLYLTGGLTYSGYEADNMVYNWNVGLGLNWNLFSGFYTAGYEEELRAQIRMYEALLDQTIQGLYLEIENFRILYEEAEQRLNLNKILLKTAEESLRLTEARYNSGLGTFIEVSDVQNVYINAKNSYIKAEYDLILSAIRLKKAIGLLDYTGRGE